MKRLLRFMNAENFFKKYEIFILILLLAVLNFFVYANTLKNNFVWDDHFFILENKEIKSLKNIPSFFNKDIEGLYRPIRTVFYSLSYKLWHLNPIGYHFQAIIINVINSILVFLIFRKIASKKTAFLAALIFAVHPVHTESISYITSSFDQIGISFFLLSFLFYILFNEKKKYVYILSSLIFFIIGIFTNEFALTLLFVIPLYDFCFNKKTMRKRIKEYSVYLFFFVFYLFIRFFLIKVIARINTAQIDYLLILATIPKIIINYIFIFLFPIKLTVQPSLSSVGSFTEFLIYFIILSFVIIMIMKTYKYSKIIFFGACWFLLTIIPVLNIIPLQRLFAETYLYLPSAGLCLVLSSFIFLFINSRKFRKFGIFLAFLIIILFSFLTINRNNVWKDDFTLWSETIKISHTSKAYNNLAIEYEKKGAIDKAVHLYEESIKINPKADTYFNLAKAYSKKGMYKEAASNYESAIFLNKNFAEAYNNLGIVYSEIGYINLSIEKFKTAIKIKPNYIEAYNNLATLYERNKMYDESIKIYKKAIMIDENNHILHYNLGVVYIKTKDYEKAKEEFEKCIQIRPDFMPAIENLKQINKIKNNQNG